MRAFVQRGRACACACAGLHPSPLPAPRRYVFSMWFTCDEAREFGTFLDGKAHSTFKGVKREGAQGGEL